MNKIHWSPQAEKDIFLKLDYVAGFSKKAAIVYNKKIQGDINMLIKNPRSGRRSIINKLYRLNIVGAPFWVVYEYESSTKTINILMVNRNGQDDIKHAHKNDDESWTIL